MNITALKKFAAGIGVASVLGIASVGLGAGEAQARDWCWWGWCDLVPPPGQFVPSPGHIGQTNRRSAGPLGQARQVVQIAARRPRGR